MKESEKIGLHGIYLLFGNILVMLLSFAITVFITRQLGPTDFGVYSFVISIPLFLAPIALLGLSGILQRSVSFYLGRRDFGAIKGYTSTISKIIFYSTSLAAVSLALSTFLFPEFFRYPSLILTTVPYFFFLVFYTLFSSGFLSGSRKFGIAVFLDVLSRALLLLSIVYLIVYRIPGIIFANTLAIFIPLMILILVMVKYFSNIRAKHVDTKGALTFSLRFFAAQSLFGILLYLNIFVLTHFASQFGIEQVGFYSLASNIEFYSENFLMFLGAATTPAIIQYYGERNLRRVNQAVHLGFKYTFLLVFPAMFSFVAVADVVVSDLFGTAYANSIPLLQILAFTLASTMLLRMLLPIVLAKNFVKTYLYLAAALLLVTLPLSFVLTSQFSAYGSAVSRIIPLAIGTFIFTFIIFRKAHLQFPLKDLVGEFSLALIFLLLFFVPRDLLWVIPSFFLLLGAYIGLLLVAGIFDRSDLIRVTAFLRRLRNHSLT